MIPEKLYQYQPPSVQATLNLATQLVFFSNPADFNDPYDCVIEPTVKRPTEIELDAILASLSSQPGLDPQSIDSLLDASPERVTQLAMQFASNLVDHHRRNFNNGLGVVCFSEENSNLLMWSHYGAQHKGYCLEFDTRYDPLTKCKPVKYSSTIPQIDPVKLIVDRDLDVFMDLFCTKSIDWAYEKEWRSMHFKPRKTFGFDPAALTGIYFGSRISIADRNTLSGIAAKHYPNALLYQGRRSIDRYEIVFDALS